MNVQFACLFTDMCYFSDVVVFFPREKCIAGAPRLLWTLTTQVPDMGPLDSPILIWGNKDGTIDRAELITLLQQLDAKTWDSKRVNRLMSTIDVKQDQLIQLDEFCNWLFLSDPSFQKHRFVDALISLSPDVKKVFPAGGSVKAERM